ncbi:MAG: NAD(P)-dependent oxidoreductase [Actinomycetota bacterium]
MTRVAVIGLGRMGAAMAAVIHRAGFDLVVWNRSPDKAARVSESLGVEAAGSAAEAAAGAEVVVSSLADDAALDDVHTGPGGTLEGVREGAVVVETSTVDPGTITRLAPGFEEKGAHLLDAPVSGSVALVERGELTSMVGGDAAALEKARPVLEATSKAVFHLGPPGAGATMKLAVNSLVHATNLAIAEALVLAEKAGIDRSQAYEVFASGAGASPFLLYKRQAFEDPEEAPVAFSVDLMRKDMDLILELAQRLEAPMRQLTATSRVTDEAIQEGMGPRDMSSVAVYLREH